MAWDKIGHPSQVTSMSEMNVAISPKVLYGGKGPLGEFLLEGFLTRDPFQASLIRDMR